jgi:hypothetical protein
MIKQFQEENGVHRSQRGPGRSDQSESVFARPSEPMAVVRKKRRSRQAAMQKVVPLHTLDAERPKRSPTMDHHRLPSTFDPSRPVATPDAAWEYEMYLMAERNRESDRERMLLNRRRYINRKRRLKLSRGEQPYNLAA